MISRRQLVVGSAPVATLSASLVAHAFPDRSIKLVIPMAAGEATERSRGW